MPNSMTLLDMTGKMLLAVALGGLVGYERETHGRPAGLRTHILVCLGAAVFTITSLQVAGIRFDPGRIAANIVTGIGFLGAGTIIRQGSIVRGLTTAASLWTVAAIGMAVGVGRDNMVWVAIVAAVVVLATLSIITRVEYRLVSRQRYRDLVITVPSRSALTQVLNTLASNGVDVLGVEEEDITRPHALIYRLRLRFPASFDVPRITEVLSSMPDVRGLQWD